MVCNGKHIHPQLNSTWKFKINTYEKRSILWTSFKVILKYDLIRTNFPDINIITSFFDYLNIK